MYRIIKIREQIQNHDTNNFYREKLFKIRNDEVKEIEWEEFNELKILWVEELMLHQLEYLAIAFNKMEIHRDEIKRELLK